MLEIAPRDLATLEAQVRAAVDDVLVHIDAALPPVILATMRAAIEPLAVECAPDRRINAIVSGADASPDDLAAAIRWLCDAASTTGQLLEIGGV